MSIAKHLALFFAAACLFAADSKTPALSITTLSSKPNLVSGGDALVEIRVAGASSPKVTVKLNGADVTQSFRPDAQRGSLVGLVQGLHTGANTLAAKAGAHTASLELVNHPISGPILSGEHLSPFVCMTEESGLGKPLDSDCSAATKIEYFYRATDASFKPLPDPKSAPADLVQTVTSDGRSVPYIVRVESGTINRAIYHIAILDDPAKDAAPWSPGPGWNRRLVYSFGGGCGSNYNQGRSPATAALFDPALARGFAHITSTQNVYQQHCNDELSGEAVMMIKEHFIKRYGLPAWTVGFGGSGGSIQQLLIAQNFPGLLDGLLPSLTYPDSVSITPDITDCRLLNRYMQADPQNWTKDKQAAVDGYSPGTCNAWDRSFVNTIVAANSRGCGIPAELTYDPVKNPKGARCTTWDTNAATFGRDASGATRTPLDNAGVQYGLKALNRGAITKQEFLDLNRKIGGYDRDGNPRAERSVGDSDAVRLAYLAGRVDEAGGSLPQIPILQFRTYNDPLGDIHDRVRDFVVRERLRKANGNFDNQVIWIFPNGNRPLAAKVTGLAIDTMTKWLDTHSKPAAAVDGCWTNDGTRIDEPAVFGGPGKCNDLFPIHLTPRLVAGAPLSDDVLKCQLKPVDEKDYAVTFSADEMQQLRTIFPGGVCDYSKPGQNQVPLAGTYLALPLATSAASTR